MGRGLHLAGSTKTVGRIDFVLRILVATALAVELNRLIPLKELLNLYDYPSRLGVFVHLAGYPLIAILALSAIVGRLLDARLPVLYFLPVTIVWIFSSVSFMFGTRFWPIGLALFVLLLIAGGVLPINPAPVRIGFGDKSVEGIEETPLLDIVNTYLTSGDDAVDDEVQQQPEQDVKRRRYKPISPSAFLVALTILSALSLPLIYLDGISGQGLGVWFARLGYAVLGFFWLGISIQRLSDAGWAYGFYPIQYLLAVAGASLMPLAFRWVNGYGALAIFFLIQTPIVLLKSKPSENEPLPQKESSEGTVADSARSLGSLGGTMPEMEDIPRRRVD